MRTPAFITIAYTGFICAFLSTQESRAQLPAFPGAEGGGRLSVGGRGGRVIEVTNHNDSGEGSLRAAVTAKGARTVVFRVSGTITLNSRLTISNDSITIAGQTAPGDGICIRRYDVAVNARHVIIRYLRFRVGDESGGERDAIGGTWGTHIMIDHCSASWGLDEVMSLYGADSLTVQWCIISESLYNSTHPKGKHGYGGIWGGTNSTFHHNLIASHSSRTPRFSGGNPPDPSKTPIATNLDFRNNVIYNWGSNGVHGGEGGTFNIIANYYKPGPATRSTVRNRIVEPYDANGKWFLDANVAMESAMITADNWAGGVQGSYANQPQIKATSPFPFAPVTTHLPAVAYNHVLNTAGAVLPRRDAVDMRIVNEARTGTATYDGSSASNYRTTYNLPAPTGIIDSQNDVGGWPDLQSLPAPPDSDKDGMPDDWETANGLNPNDPEDRNRLATDGYTMLEVYLNSLTSVITGVAQSTQQLPEQFSLLQNYPNPFNPSTTIAYEIPSSGRVKIEIVDLLGRMVEDLSDQEQAPGRYEIRWDGTDGTGRQLASGMYIAVVRFESTIRTLKLQLIR